MTNPDPRLLTQVKQYRFVRELGRGGMGTVFEAVDTRDGARVAVKLLHPWLAAEDSSFRDRFEREAHIAALLRSPYSVRLLDFGVADGTYFLVMEYVEGANVGDELKKGPLEPLRALRIAIDVARALEEAAARGVIHRDIKPDNILLTPDGRVKVTDFGIARQEGGTGLTSAGRFVGTAEYAAPEQAVGDADHRSDIYALGATLYCMLAGHPPFQGTSVWDVIRAHQTQPIPMVPLTNLPDSICNPIRRCMEKDPRDRYQSASELAGALERALAAFLHATESPRGSVSRPMAQPGLSGQAERPSQPAPAPQPPPGAADATRITPMPPASAQPQPQPARYAAPAATPAPAAPAPAPPQATGRANVTMVAVPIGEPRADVSDYELTITNQGAAPAALTLAAVEPSGLLAISVARDVSLAPHETQRLRLQVRQIRPSPGARTIQFQVAAQNPDGSRAGFVNATFIPVRGGAKAGSNRILFAVVGAAAVVAIGAAAFLLTNRGGGSSNSSGTATPSGGAATAASGASIQVLDRWDYSFGITSTTCSFGAHTGDRYAISFRFQPASGNGTAITDGEQVNVTALQNNAISLGTFTFHAKGFQFNYPVLSDGAHGTATLTTNFADAKTIGSATLSEQYDSPACTITANMGQ